MYHRYQSEIVFNEQASQGIDNSKNKLGIEWAHLKKPEPVYFSTEDLMYKPRPKINQVEKKIEPGILPA